MNRLLCFILLCSLYATANAGAFQVPLEGMKQSGMGGAGTAFAQDASVMFYNPGGLAFTTYNQISLSALVLDPKIQFLDAGTNNLYTTQTKLPVPFNFYASYSTKDSSNWKVGLGIYTPYGADISWPSGWAGRYVLESADLFTVNVQPTFSYKIANKIGLGASVVYSLGSVNLLRGVPLQDTAGNTATADLKGKASGVGFNVGAYYQVTPQVAIGLSYKYKITYDVKHGAATFQNIPPSLQDSFINTSFSSSLSVPYELDGGVCFKPTPKAALDFDVNYTGWKVFNVIDINLAQTNSIVTDMVIPNHYTNSFTFRLGGQYVLDSTFTIRAGTYLDLSPVPEGFISPEVPDANRYCITAGLTMHRGHFEADLCVAFLQTLERTEVNDYAGLNGIYRGQVFTVGLGVNYNFYKDKKKQTSAAATVH